MDLQWELEGLEEAAGPSRPSACEDRLISAHLAFLLKTETTEAARVSGADPSTEATTPPARRFEDPPTCSPRRSQTLSRAAPSPSHPVQLARAVELCSLQHRLRPDGRQCSVEELAAALAARGFAAHVCRSAGGGAGTAAFRNLRHTFITVCGAGCAHPGGCGGQGGQAEEAGEEGHHAGGAQRLLVDPHFKCSFTVAAPTPRYAHLQALLPQCFVGTPEQLEHLVDWVCRCAGLGEGMGEGVGLGGTRDGAVRCCSCTARC